MVREGMREGGGRGKMVMEGARGRRMVRKDDKGGVRRDEGEVGEGGGERGQDGEEGSERG